MAEWILEVTREAPYYNQRYVSDRVRCATRGPGISQTIGSQDGGNMLSHFLAYSGSRHRPAYRLIKVH